MKKLEMPFNFKANCTYGLDYVRNAILNASTYNSNVGGILHAGRIASARYCRDSPTDEWFRSLVAELDEDTVELFFDRIITQQLQGLKIPKKGLDIAIDIHNIPRYDKDARNLRRSKHKGGTHTFESYITAQCTNRKCKIILACMRIPSLYTAAEFVPKIVQKIRNFNIPIKLIMADREFFSTQVISYFNSQNIPYLTPCRNTSTVIQELQGFARDSKKYRRTVIENNKMSAPYTMIVTRRNKSRNPELAEFKHIGFASNRRVNVLRYRSRWEIENGYKMIEAMRIKTRSNNVAARMFCFVCSILMYNMWIMARIAVNYSKRAGSFTQIRYKLVIQAIISYGIFLEPEPPPPKNGRC